MLEEIADGAAVEEIRLELSDVLTHLECPECHGPLVVKKGRGEVTIEALRTARPNDHIKAADTLGKYGPGQKINAEINVVHPEVQSRLQATVTLIAERAPEMMNDLERIWCD